MEPLPDDWRPPRLVDLRAIAQEQSDEAYELLSHDYSKEPTWFSQRLTDVVGPVMHGLTLVCARPGGGKTTVMLNQTAHMLEQGAGLIYCGTEMRPARLKVMLACHTLSLDFAAVIRNQWDQLPPDARERVLLEVGKLETDHSERVVFVPDDRIDLKTVRDWADIAKAREIDTIVIDHLHRMSWGSDPTQLTAHMTEGLRQLSSLAKDEGLRLLCAAQLRRGQHDPLEDFMVPSQSSIKSSGAAEEEADLVLMLHRALRTDATEGDLTLVRRGQRAIRDVEEVGTLAVHVAKSRLAGDIRDTEVRLYVAKGKLFDHPLDRDDHLARVLGGGR